MPSPRKTTTPSADARPSGSAVTSACTCTRRERPGASANRSGRTENEIARRAPREALDVGGEREPTRRDVAHDDPRHGLPADVVRATERERAGARRELGRRGRAEVEQARALRGERASGKRPRRVREQAAERARIQRRTRVREQRGGTAHDRGRGARTVDGAEARRPVGVRAGLRGRDPDALRDDVGLHAAVEREPARRERRDATQARVRVHAHRPDREHGLRADAHRGDRAKRGLSRDPDDGNRNVLVEAERAARRRARRRRGRSRRHPRARRSRRRPAATRPQGSAPRGPRPC